MIRSPVLGLVGGTRWPGGQYFGWLGLRAGAPSLAVRDVVTAGLRGRKCTDSSSASVNTCARKSLAQNGTVSSDRYLGNPSRLEWVMVGGSEALVIAME